MMTAVDGRIDCAMTEQLPGVQEYYSTLDAACRAEPRQRARDGTAGDGAPRNLRAAGRGARS